MLAVIFSKGFGWIDDQFLVVEIAQSWVDGTDYYRWLPWTEGNTGPKGFSFFYVGLHYILFRLSEFAGITDPQAKMYIVRLLHALWSLLIIVYGYRITRIYGSERSARLVGWLLALFWIFPFLSVRTLVEYVSIPFFMAAIYLIATSGNKVHYLRWLWIGFLLGLAINVRYQTGLIALGVGIALLVDLRWKETSMAAAGAILSLLIFQGLVDYLIWGEPFIQMISYVSYNASAAGEYTVGPWYHYILFLLAAMIPPVSLFILAGFLRSYRRVLIIFLPVLLFILFHSWYPNKQERFIVTIIPLLFIAGLIGWKLLVDGVLNPPFMQRIIRYSWVFFWIINFILLLPVTVMYSKKARVESMVYLSQYPQVDYFIIEDVNKDVLRFPPQFYLGHWAYYEAIMKKDNFGDFSRRMKEMPAGRQPQFILFYQPNNIEERVERMKSVLPGITFETMIEPGMMDEVLHWLNPINDNQNIYIYRNSIRIPAKVTSHKKDQ